MKKATQKTMNRILNTLLAGMLILTFGCVPGSNVNLTQGSRGLPGFSLGVQSQKEIAQQQDIRLDTLSQNSNEYREYLKTRQQQLKLATQNKMPYTGPINIQINTGLVESNPNPKILTIKSSPSGFSTQAVPAGPTVFQEQFVRSQNPIKGEKREFTVSDISKVYTLHIQNGDAQGNNTVSSAVININGQDWVRPNDFKGKGTLEVQKDSILLNANNTITIDVSGSPGSTMIVTVLEGGLAGTIRRKNGPLTEHPDQDAHVAGNDRNIFDPAVPGSLGDLDPFEGDFKIALPSNEAISFSAASLNDEIIEFQQRVVSVGFKDDSSREQFLSLYGGKILQSNYGLYLIELDLDKAPIKDTEILIRSINQLMPDTITKAVFSSLAAYKTFVILMDAVVNHTGLITMIEPSYKVTAGGHSVIPGETPVVPSDWLNDPGSWGLLDTHVPEAWNYSIGTGVRVAWHDIGITNHPELSRRLLIGPGFQNVNVFSIVSSALSDHGNVAATVGFGERDNYLKDASGNYVQDVSGKFRPISTVGVAPNAQIIPYNHLTHHDKATNILNSVILGGAHLIGSSTYCLFCGSAPMRWIETTFLGGNILNSALDIVINQLQIPVVHLAGNGPDKIGENIINLVSGEPGVNVKDMIPNGNIPNIIMVGAVGKESGNLYRVARWSNFGRSVMYAPGVGLSCADGREPTKLTLSDGTSVAAPFLTGIVALMLSRNPNLTPPQIIQILRSSSQIPLNPPNHNKFVHPDGPLGMIDALAAVKQVSSKKTETIFGVVDNGTNKKILLNQFVLPNSPSAKKQKEINIQTVSDFVWEKVLIDSNFVGVRGWSDIKAGKIQTFPIPLTTVLMPFPGIGSIPSNTRSIKTIATGEVEVAQAIKLCDASNKQVCTTNTVRSGFRPELNVVTVEQGGIAQSSFSGSNDFEVKLNGLPAQGKIFVNPTNPFPFNVNFYSQTGKINPGTGDPWIDIPIHKDNIIDIANDGTFIKFRVNKTDLPTGGLPVDLYKIGFEGINGRSINALGPTSTSSFTVAAITSGTKPDSFDVFNNTEVNDKVVGWADGVTPVEVGPGDLVGVTVIGDKTNLKILIAGKEVTIEEVVDNFIAFGIPNTIPEGLHDIIIQAGGGNITLENAIKILVPPSTPSNCSTDEVITNSTWKWKNDSNAIVPVSIVNPYASLVSIPNATNGVNGSNVLPIWSELNSDGTAKCSSCSYIFFFDYSLPSGASVDTARVQVQADDFAEVIINGRTIGTADFASTFGKRPTESQEFIIPSDVFSSGNNNIKLLFLGSNFSSGSSNFAAIAAKFSIKRCQ